MGDVLAHYFAKSTLFGKYILSVQTIETKQICVPALTNLGENMRKINR